MRIFLDVGEFGRFFIDASPGDTVQSIQVRIEAALGIPPSEQNILFGGSHLTGDQTLYNCQINDGCTIRCYWYSSDGGTRLGFDVDSYITGDCKGVPSQTSGLGSERHESRRINLCHAHSMPEGGAVSQADRPSRRRSQGDDSSEIAGESKHCRHQSKSSEGAQGQSPPQAEVVPPCPISAVEKMHLKIQPMPIEARINPVSSSSTRPNRASAPVSNSDPDHELAEAIAASILGDFVNAPTVQLMKATQGDRMDRLEWEAVKKALEENPRARTDIACLARLMEGMAVLQK